MTLSLHKLWAGSGYEYLTRQVARLDASHARGELVAYYEEKGEAPGSWVGRGLGGVDGLAAGDPVAAAQMRSLFGEGRHPLAEGLVRAASGGGASNESSRAVGHLGAPFRCTQGSSAFASEVDAKLAADVPPSSARSPLVDARARAVSAVATEWFVRDHGRPPADERELTGAVARYGRPPARPVAGYDLTFSPVKSVSALWALAERAVAAKVEQAHRSAVGDALAFLEREALFSREGTNGVRQVQVTGLVAAAFTHRDSRAGDPDLHTHVAVANKVQTLQGRWLAIDGRTLYAAVVAASETYNTSLEAHLVDVLGVQFVERPTSPGRRPVREIDGVEPRLLDRWSARRQAITDRQGELARKFQNAAGRPPTREEAWELAQQATLETRPAKHEPRSLAEQRTTWRSQAIEMLGSPDAVRDMITTSLTAVPAPPVVDAAWVGSAAATVLRTVESERAVWRTWHIHAEASRIARTAGAGPGMVGHVTDLVTAEVLQRCIRLTVPLIITKPITVPRRGGAANHPHDDHDTDLQEPVVVPEALLRSDGTSVYTRVEAIEFTSRRILTAEDRVLATAARRDGHRVGPADVEVAITGAALDGVRLNRGQAELVRSLAGSGARLQLALAPAGTGKTTALRVLAHAWTSARPSGVSNLPPALGSGSRPPEGTLTTPTAGPAGQVVGLAPSAAAAAVLGENLEVTCETLAKLVWSLGIPVVDRPTWVNRIGADTLVLVDEAGLADTISLDAAVAYVVNRGGSVRLIGDDRQLSSPGAGGLLSHLATATPTARLHEVVRFTDPAEAAASLALRDGRPEALGFYLDQGRVHVGDTTTATDQLFTAWLTDRQAGLDSLMLAPTNDLATALNQRARDHRLKTHPRVYPQCAEVALRDGTRVSVGDLVITRRNDRRLRAVAPPPPDSSDPRQRGRCDTAVPLLSNSSEKRWVRNGDRWVVDAVAPDGALRARSVIDGRRVTLPSAYVADCVQLGYASTIHAAQGSTCDTVHGLITGAETRAQLYTLLTRGRTANHLYLATSDPEGVESLADHPATVTAAAAGRSSPDPEQPSPTETLEQVLQRDGIQLSAHATRAAQHHPATRLHEAVARYLDGIHVALDTTTPPATHTELAETAEQLVPRLTLEPGWPSLRATLLLAELHDPVRLLRLAATTRELDTAHDRCAVLTHRVHQLRPPACGPLGFLPSIPQQVTRHPEWGPYLDAAADLVRTTADALRACVATTDQPGWAADIGAEVNVALVAEVEQFRAISGVRDDESSPTGPPQLGLFALRQRQLDRQLNTGRREGTTTGAAFPDLRGSDSTINRLQDRLRRLPTGRAETESALDAALKEGALPDDYAAAALWWRLHRYLPPDQLDVTPRSAPPAQDQQLLAPTSRIELLASDRPRLADVDTRLLVAAFDRIATTRARQQPPTPVSYPHIVSVNEAALDFYRGLFPRSWASDYLQDRLGVDLTADERFQPGLAPDSWTALITHLRHHGVSDDHMITAGLARRAGNGRLIDVHRHRLILPIRDETGQLVGFTSRRHPDTTDHRSPKYLNTPATPAFTKGHQVYGAHLLGQGRAQPHRDDERETVPVVVEGPLDAIAITLAGKDKYLGVAPMGTALTPVQAGIISVQCAQPVLALDGDRAGRTSTYRDFLIMARLGADPHIATLPEGEDPASLARRTGNEALFDLLQRARPIDPLHLADECQDPGRNHTLDLTQVLHVVAARPPQTWSESLHQLAQGTGQDLDDLRTTFARLATAWINNRAAAAPPTTAERGRGTAQQTRQRDRSTNVHDRPAHPGSH